MLVSSRVIDTCVLMENGDQVTYNTKRTLGDISSSWKRQAVMRYMSSCHIYTCIYLSQFHISQLTIELPNNTEFILISFHYKCQNITSENNYRIEPSKINFDKTDLDFGKMLTREMSLNKSK